MIKKNTVVHGTKGGGKTTAIVKQDTSFILPEVLPPETQMVTVAKATDEDAHRKGTFLKKTLGKIVSLKGKINKGGAVLQKGCHKLARVLGYEHHVALFGESGSGKTTLLNVFYGYQQSSSFSDVSGYQFLAENIEQGNQILSQYNKLQIDGETIGTRRKSTSYSFVVSPVDFHKSTLRLVWHDYPGGWLTDPCLTAAEEERKEETFRDLMRSDVAFILVDARKLSEQGGRYLKRLFANLKDQLVRLSLQYADSGKGRLSRFPRVWFVGLSKADLMPELNVEEFRDLVYKYAYDELEDVEKAIVRMMPKRTGKYVSVKSNFILLSSAKFDPNTYKLLNGREIKGVDAIAPIACFLPIEHAMRWAKITKVVAKATHGGLGVSKYILAALATAATAAALATGSIPFVGAIFSFAGTAVAGTFSVLAWISVMGADAVNVVREKAHKKCDALKFVLASLKLQLDKCRAQHVYVERPVK